MEQLKLATLPKYLIDEAEAWLLLERLRWQDDTPVCPHCGTKDSKHYYLKARSGHRTTKAGNVSYRRIWKCRDKDCRQQFSVLVGTIFEDSKLPVSKWLLALYLCGAAKNGISALELQRHLGVAYGTAWFVLHRLREAMTREPLASLLSGTVVVDETYVGGKAKNRHRQGTTPGHTVRTTGKGKGGAKDKTPVMALICKETGEARTRIVTDVTGATLRKAIAADVDLPVSTLHTDALPAYRGVARECWPMSTLITRRGSTCGARSAPTWPSRSSASSSDRWTAHTTTSCTHHLGRYADEFAFRWNTRKMTDHRRIEAMVIGARGSGSRTGQRRSGSIPTSRPSFLSGALGDRTRHTSFQGRGGHQDVPPKSEAGDLARSPASICKVSLRMRASCPNGAYHASIDEGEHAVTTEERPPEGKEPQGRARGGVARAERLSSEERKAIATKAAAARWAEVSEAVCGSPDQPLKIGDVEIECYVLDDGRRVLTQASFLEALGRHRKANVRREGGEEQLPAILQGKAIYPYISDEVREKSRPITFKLPSGGRASGYNAELLPAVCEIYLRAADDNALPSNQEHVARQAAILVRGLAHVGIIALVDEATGYQELRTKDALAKILEAFIDKELQAWVRTFPADFYRELFRLRGLDYDSGNVKRPQYFGKLTNNIVYERLSPGVLDELRIITPRDDSGRRKHKFFQRLTTNVGYPKLREHLGSVVTLMKLSDNWEDFLHKLDRIHPRVGDTLVLPFDEQYADSGKGL